MKFFKDEEAVSPVIGVILMVAITVILAAVIAAFVFGLGSNVQKTKNVGVTVAQVVDVDGTTPIVLVTVQGGSDVAALSWINGTVDSVETCTPLVEPTDTIGPGDQMTCDFDSASDPALRNSVIIVGHFDDGSEQVLLDTTV